MKLPVLMQTKMSELVTGMDSSDPIEVVIEKLDAHADKAAEVTPTAVIATVRRR
ncbi:hypothetical protein ACXHXM_06520|uniref:hypothetical protein n=1 Tax=Rhizobium altiplani TaxID=1864509 RepID=UPI0013660B58|nr:hypothetical protein [Rhizobium altiplani]